MKKDNRSKKTFYEVTIKPAILALLIFTGLFAILWFGTIFRPFAREHEVAAALKMPDFFSDMFQTLSPVSVTFFLIFFGIYYAIFACLRHRKLLLYHGKPVYARRIKFIDIPSHQRANSVENADAVYAKWEDRIFVSKRPFWMNDYITPMEDGYFIVLVNRANPKKYIFPSSKELDLYRKIHNLPAESLKAQSSDKAV